MSRQDHRDYGAALEKIRKEAEAVMVPKRERRRKRDRAVTFILALAGIGLSLLGIMWAALCWFACLLFLADWIGNHERLIGWAPSKVRITQVTIVLCGTILGAGPVYHQWRIEKASATDGELMAGSSFNDVPDGNYAIQLDKNPVKYTFYTSNHEPWSILGDKLRFDTEDGKLKFSAVVRDRSANLIAKLDKNHWQVFPTASDKNYNGDSFEVLDARGRVVLQLKLLSNGVQLQGEWYDEIGGSFRLGGNNTNFHSNEAIKPIFKYPSKQHWAELAD